MRVENWHSKLLAYIDRQERTPFAYGVNDCLLMNELFGLGIDLGANPEQRRDPFVSAMSLFLGNKEGWWTGRKLGDYLIPGHPDFVNARRVVNGTDKAATVAGYARKFKQAIQAAAKAD